MEYRSLLHGGKAWNDHGIKRAELGHFFEWLYFL